MKFCPLLAIAHLDPADNPYRDYACIEEECAFWVQELGYRGCVLHLAGELALTLAAARFPSILSHKKY